MIIEAKHIPMYIPNGEKATCYRCGLQGQKLYMVKSVYDEYIHEKCLHDEGIGL